MPYRYACDALEELRKVNETRRYDRVLGLAEELQTMFNRMEAKLFKNRDILDSEKHLAKLKKDTKRWEKKARKAEKKFDKLTVEAD